MESLLWLLDVEIVQWTRLGDKSYVEIVQWIRFHFVHMEIVQYRPDLVGEDGHNKLFGDGIWLELCIY